jgi:hypothetical protein
LQNLQLTGSYGSFQNPAAEGYGYGGRVGYSIPTEEGKFSVGATGGGFAADTPYGNMSKRQITGGDVSYSFGPNTLSLMYDKMGQIPTTIAPQNLNEAPLKDFLRLIYKREF